ncbi:MAG: hypothetical protein J6Y36_02100 [Treponema sp.]|nr:hypothetical protein [Treponema sp.]
MNERQIVMSAHAENVLKWREGFVKLDENRFFEIMKMYLGEIKTPYNKQKLIERLESFFRNKENLTAIKSFLSKEEIEIICAIVFIPDATEDKLVSFFDGTFTYSFIYETLENLEERLVVYRICKDSGFRIVPTVYKLNPHLEDALYDLIDIKQLLSKIEYKKIAEETAVISPEFIICFIAYVSENPNLAKQDGSLKKYTLENAEQYFGSNVNRIKVLYSSFLNLGIFKDGSRGVEIDWNKLDKFSELTFVEQTAYIVASSQGHFSRDSLRLQAQIFIDTLRNLEKESFTREIFLRTGFLVSSRPRDVEETKPVGESRFSRIIKEARSRFSESENETGSNIGTSGGIDRMYEAARVLGLIIKNGISHEKKDVYRVSDIFELDLKDDSQLKGMINIEAGMEVTLMPGYSLKCSIPLIKFLSLKRFDTVCTFSISRKSVMNGFDSGLDSKKLIELLKERTAYKVPEILEVQIEDWSKYYSAASFYKGFVLKLDGKAALAAEHNKVLAPHIHTVIAPGVFLLDVSNDEEAIALLKESSLDFVGRIKTADEEIISSDFMKLNSNGRVINDATGFDEPKEIIEKEDSAKIEKKLLSALDKLSLDEEQKESLEMRIAHKVIVNESQLDTSILRLERVNASGMDFSGKIYVIEQAYKNHELVEMHFGNDDVIVRGYPVGIQPRKDNDTTVHVHLEKENTVREYSVGKAKSVKRIRKSIYGK